MSGVEQVLIGALVGFLITGGPWVLADAIATRRRLHVMRRHSD